MEVTCENVLAKPDFGICLNHCPFNQQKGDGDFWVCYSELLEPTRDRPNGKYELLIKTRPNGGSSLCILFRIAMPRNQFDRSRTMKLLDIELNGWIYHSTFLRILFNAIQSGFFEDAEIVFYAHEQSDVSCPLYLEHCILSQNDR